MKENLITISESGVVSVPDNVQMRDFEIAELFGLMIPTIRSHVCAILKTGIATDDYTNGATLVGCNILPDYYGLDMITALAFRINSPNAQLFRGFILHRMASTFTESVIPIYIFVNRGFMHEQSEYRN